ncbi:polysaccharide deacetylase family protein [Gorillibacterium sp. sgz500922]|uniref:polysaccharide deacetylase family protein n=1 Tax=Gorillibacterium sp. sgz500922 TaxID=3446694 RepID=UPI003F66FB3B
MNGNRGGLTGFFRKGTALLAVFLLLWGSFPAMLSAESKASPSSAANQLYQSLSSGKRISVPAAPGVASPGGDDASESQEGGKVVYLTFDDGPSKLTPQVLDILQREQVKATFFELGELAEQRPQLTKRVVAEGHALGNHSYDHVYKELYGSFEGFWNQITRTEAIFYRIAGLRPELVRPPGGSYTNFDSFYFYLLEQGGYRVFDWNVDSTDASRRGVPAEAIERAVLGAPLKDRMVVLMHDGAGHEESVKALPAVIRHFKENGYRFDRLDAAPESVQFRLGKVKWQRALGFGAFEKLLAEAAEHRTLLVREPSGGAAGPAGVVTTAKGEETAGQGKTPENGNTSQAVKAAEPVKPAAGLSAGTDALLTGTNTEVRPAEGSIAVPPAGGLNRSAGLAAVSGSAGPAPEPGKLTVRVNGKSWTFTDGEYELDGGRFTVPLSAVARMLGGVYTAGPDGERLQIGLTRLTLAAGGSSVAVEFPGEKTASYPLVKSAVQAGGERRIALRTAIELAGGSITGYALNGTGGIVDAECPVRLVQCANLAPGA